MFKNYIKTTFRSLQKYRAFAFINVFGLSVGIACFLLLALYVTYHYSFDRFHKNAAHIYRPYEWDRLSGGHAPLGYTDVSGSTPATLGEAMKQYLPDVMDYVQLELPWGETLVRVGNNVSRVSMSYADPSFFSIFSFPLHSGDTSSALHGLNDVVLSRSRARQLFGNSDPMGKNFEIQIGTAFQLFKVSAVAEDAPANSTIQYDVIGNFQFAERHHNQFFIGNNWHPTVRQTYVILKPGSKLPGDGRRLSKFMQTYDQNFLANTKDYIANMKKAGVEWKDSELPVSLRMQPLLDMHTDMSFRGWSFTDYGKIDRRIIWILLAIAIGILFIACINFTTLAIGRSASRGKEVGVRKVMGAWKGQLVFQFLSEAMLLSFVSGVSGLLLAISVLPLFNQMAGVGIRFSPSMYPQLFLLLVIVVPTVGLLAGSYPALVLSRFKPLEVLKNKIRVGGANVFTKSLVIFQFVLSIVLIVATVVILQQTRYMMTQNPGFAKENVVVIDATQEDPNIVFPLFKEAALRNAVIKGVTSAAAGLGAGQDFLGFSDYGLSADINVVDTGYINVLGMQLIAGGNLRQMPKGDTSNHIIINETMMKAFGWNLQDAIGKPIPNFQGRTAIVTGVVRNFHYQSMSESIHNQVFETSPDKGYSHFYVRIQAGSMGVALAALRNTWAGILPGIPMKFSFLDEDVNSYYIAENKWSGIVGIAGGIAIFLASLGLLGLATLAAVNRTKEIGIRKVLGASVADIVRLVSKDFLQLVVIAFLIATPVAWYCLHRWLEGYAYRIIMSWWVFAGAGILAIVTALVTICFHSIKAAFANPVTSLRAD